jgi:small subunit ribosomal protein S9
MAEKHLKAKKTEKKPKAEKKTAAPMAPEKKERYFEAVGRRKTAIARVRLFTKKNGLEVNNSDYQKYFSVERLRRKAFSPLEEMKISDKLGGVIKVRGGGINAQAEATCLGIARALTKFNPDFKKRLRRLGYLTRDQRAVERKKFGLKKARRAPQWKKR